MGAHTKTGDEDSRRVLDCIRRVVQALRQSSRNSEQRIGLSGAQLFVLQKLAEHGETVSLNELAQLTLTHQSSVSVVVQRLVDRGLVLRTVSANDGRRLELSLTKHGRQAARAGPDLMQHDLLRALQSMPGQQRKKLAALLHEFLELAGISDRPPPLFFEDTRIASSRRRKKRGS